jgi:large subunit ribosomal protein L24
MAEKKGRAARETLHIKAGDTVFVRTGKDRESKLSSEEVARLTPAEQVAEANKRSGKRGRVLRVLPEKNRVIVEGANILTKHARPQGRTTRAAQLQTGRTQAPGPISVANVMLVCPSCDRPTRVRRGDVEGKPVRICRRCGESVDAIR